MVPVLRASGHEVTGLDTFYYADCGFGEASDRVPARRKDVRDVEADDLDGFDAVVHLAAVGGHAPDDLHAAWIHAIDHQASVRLAELARESGVQRFLYASSWRVYGSARSDEVLAENAPLRPASPAAVAKARTEESLAKLADGSFSPIFMRSAATYGLSPRLRVDGLLNSLVFWAHLTGCIRVVGDGSPWYSVVHAQDVARAFAVALAAPRDAIHGHAFNVGANGENYQIRELVEIVRSTVPGCSVQYAEADEPAPGSCRVDFSKLVRTFPDFRPEWNALFGAKDLYAALLEAGMTLSDFEGGKYIRGSRINHLRTLGVLDASLRWAVPA
jgi:nucleoside-diphosphate-sugar epimerase